MPPPFPRRHWSGRLIRLAGPAALGASWLPLGYQGGWIAAIRGLAAPASARILSNVQNATSVREAKDWRGAVTRIVGAIALLTMLPLLDANVKAALACAVSDIQIKQANLVHRGSGGQFSTVVGELVNGCSEATGVQLHITLRDATGRIIATGDPWPAGVHNIPPQRPYAFTVNAAEDGGGADSLKVDVTEVIRW